MLKSALIKVYRYMKAITQSIKLYFRHISYRRTVAPAHYIFHISPAKIQWLTNREDTLDEAIRNRNFPMETFRGKVMGGNWDNATHKFEELAVYKAIRQRIVDKTCWADTEYYSECMDDINNGRVLWKCTNSKQLLKRFAFIDDIVLDIKNNGYKAGYESCIEGEDSTTLAKNRKYSDEITINIGREGGLFFQDGRHRLAIAKILQIPSVPVKVLVRHELWLHKLRCYKNSTLKVIDFQHPDMTYLKGLNKK